MFASDYVCPFCYLAEPIIEQVKKEFPHLIEVRWRAYELRPGSRSNADFEWRVLHRVWSQAVYPMAAERGIKVRLPPVQPRSRLAHEAVAFARLHNNDMELHHAIFRRTSNLVKILESWTCWLSWLYNSAWKSVLFGKL